MDDGPPAPAAGTDPAGLGACAVTSLPALAPLGAGSVRAVACTAPDSLLTLGDGSAVVVIRAGSASLISDDEDPSSTKPTPGVTGTSDTSIAVMTL